MGRILCLLIGGLFLISSYGQNKAVYNYVDPFIGTGGHGHTYPGVATPFGMIQLSPDSRLDGWDGCGGYHYSDSILYGFSHTHLSGTGVSDYGDLLIMPFTGKYAWESGYGDTSIINGYGTSFQHETEKANAGYYSVLLKEDDITVELTTTTRCGFHQYTYPKWEKKKIIIDLEHRDRLLESDLILINDSTLIGRRVSDAWAKEQHFYFTIQFSEAAVKTSFRKNKDGRASKLILEFGHVNPVLQIKVGISSVGIDGAKFNLKSEMPLWDFDFYKNACQEKWANELNKIRIYSENETNKTIFYTSLYHAYLNPNTFSDVNGKYRGMDNEIHIAKNRNQYTVFSLWDTFRAAHPLFTITQEKRTGDFIATFLAQYKEGGILPIWELSANYTGCMIGYHAIPVIVDAYVKGIRNFDTDLALRAMLHSAEQNHLGLDDYKKRGYISSENESESVSKTLEYAYDDWCIAIFADSLGQDSIAAIYYERAQYYKNIYNSSSKFMQPRYNGGWKTGFQPDEVNFNYTEANSWQYSLFVPQDVNGLTDLLGGKDQLEVWLDSLFTTSSKTSGRDQVDITGLIGQYAHGNEPSHHLAYMYNFTNSPWKTQKYVSQILNTLYTDQPDGLSGNEDCGQMSAWYVLSSLGIYSFTPGSDIYLTSAPLFDSAFVHLENGNVFSIKRTNYVIGNDFVKYIFLNGEKINRNFIYHSEIIQGGELVFEMDNQPHSFNGEFPLSAITKNTIIPSPVVINTSPSFAKKTRVAIHSNTDSLLTMRYTTDGTQPSRESKKYKKPIQLKKTGTIKVRSFTNNNSSKVVKADFKRINTNWGIEIKTPYSNAYSAGGDQALINQIKGNDDFRTGAWQGYYGMDIVVELDFKKKKKISALKMTFLQDIRSWVWLPSEVSFLVSENGKDWFTIHTAKNTLPIDTYGTFIRSFGFKKQIKTRFLKIVAKNRGICPDWHLGAGNNTWIFSDEIWIE